MYKLLKSRDQENIFSPKYKNRYKNYIAKAETLWEDIFWDKLLYYVSDIFEEYGIQIDYLSSRGTTYLILYNDNGREINRINYRIFANEIRNIWLSPNCNNFSQFRTLILQKYQNLLEGV